MCALESTAQTDFPDWDDPCNRYHRSPTSLQTVKFVSMHTGGAGLQSIIILDRAIFKSYF
ncbi:MAG: hypothetical protein CME32_15725 [Gimesia sp.]|nr:hypothetical protein [Gimesia sp.]